MDASVICRVAHLNESFRAHFFQQFEKVTLTTFYTDFEFLKDDIANFGDTSRLLKQIPDTRAHRIHPIVNAVLKVQNGRFVTERARDLFAGGNHY